MRVFVSEYITCGAMHDELELPASLLNEGGAMQAAIVTDLARSDSVDVITTWDDRFPPPQVPTDVVVNRVASVNAERELFFELARTAEATLVIAPEFENRLLERRQWVTEADGNWLGCDAEAIAICSDKLRTARVLESHGLPIVPTSLIETEQLPPWSWPVVVKPRDGAGSVNVRRIESLPSWQEILRSRTDEEFCPPELVQPFVDGEAISVGAIVSRGGSLNVFPVATQELTNDGQFAYTGGQVPAAGTNVVQADIERLVARIHTAIPGLGGYFGVDLIAGDNGVTIIEINPRLTTSYLGYRQLTTENLAARWLATTDLPPIAWNAESVRFEPTGL